MNNNIRRRSLAIAISSAVWALTACTTVKINAHNNTDRKLDLIVYKTGEEDKPLSRTPIEKGQSEIGFDAGKFSWGTNISAVLALPDGGYKAISSRQLSSSPNPTTLTLSADSSDWPTSIVPTDPDTILTRLYGSNGEPSPNPDAETFVEQWLGGIYEDKGNGRFLIQITAKDLRGALNLPALDCNVFGNGGSSEVKKEIITDSSNSGQVKVSLPSAIQSEFSGSFNSKDNYKYKLIFQNVIGVLDPTSPLLLMQRLEGTEEGRKIASLIKSQMAAGHKYALLSSAQLVKPQGGKCGGRGKINVESYKAKELGFSVNLKAADYATITGGYQWDKKEGKTFDAVGVVLGITYVPIELYSLSNPKASPETVANKLQEGVIKPGNVALQPSNQEIKIEGADLTQPPPGTAPPVPVTTPPPPATPSTPQPI